MYKVILTKYALKELASVNKEDQQKIFDRIKDMRSGDFVNDRQLKGKHVGKFRKRCGNYRIVYLKENDVLLITVIRIAHR